MPRAAGREYGVEPIGSERQPLATLDGFAAHPELLRAAAAATPFGPAREHYPGIRAPLPPDYLNAQLPVIAAVLGREFCRVRRLHVVDASFSMVTTPTEALTLKQRLPHCDAFGSDRIALIHYLSPEGGDGTAFYRHRSTGFETVDEARAPTYFARLDAELGEHGPPPPAYIAGDTPLFTQTARAAAHYNRALLYRSFVLHSGAIAPDAPLLPDPAHGRLTVTAFFAIE